MQHGSPPQPGGDLGSFTGLFYTIFTDPVSKRAVGPEVSMRVLLAGTGVAPRARPVRPPEDLATPLWLSCHQALACGAAILDPTPAPAVYKCFLL